MEEYKFIVNVLLSMTISVVYSQVPVIEYRIFEETQPGTLIGDLMKDGNLRQIYDIDAITNLRFNFLAQPAVDLSLDNETGMIFTSGRTDRDFVCASQETCKITIEVAVSPVEYFRIIKASLEIMDLNDNSPTFASNSLNYVVFESKPQYTTALSIPEARDPDRPSNSVQNYVLIESDDTWRLEVKENSNGRKDVSLVLLEPLDRETKDSYELTVQAWDGGEPPRSGSVRVLISVGDTNDNIPQFEKTSYEIDINENIKLHKSIIQIRAEDADEGANGQIIYSLSPRTAANLGHMFGIDNRTGVVFAKSNVDYEENSSYRLTIVARDMGPESTEVSVPLFIRVNDLNDHAPSISIHTVYTLNGADTNVSFISEDAPVETFVAQVKVSDQDRGASGHVLCSLADPAFRLLPVSGEYQIVSAVQMDRERIPEFSLVLNCSDQGIPQQSSMKNIHVTVRDVNDNPPQFAKSVFSAEILENNKPDAAVMAVNASDPDEGVNAALLFTIVSNNTDTFMINMHTGVIIALKQLDREKQEQHIVEVTATDHGSPQLNASTIVEINVLDVNDEPPRFTEDDFVFSVAENKARGELVGVLVAEDRDGAGNNEFLFSLLADSSHIGKFEVDSASGEVRTAGSLDREEQSRYHVVALARDVTKPSLSSITSVTISVTDINDNAPKFLFPIEENHTVYVRRDSDVDTVIAKVQTYDADLGDNAIITYNITSGNDRDCFEINHALGIITVKKTLEVFVPNSTIHLQLNISDNGEPQLSARTYMKIVILETRGDLTANANFLIVIIVACASGCLIIVLLIVIIVLLRKQQIKRQRMSRYNCRMQTLQRLGAQDIKVTAAEIEKAKEAALDEEPASERDIFDKSGEISFQKLGGLTQDTSMYCSQNRLELSHQKSQQWLASLDVGHCKKHGEFSDADKVHSFEFSPSSAERGQADGQDKKSSSPVKEVPLSTIRHWPLLKHNLPIEDTSSIRSGDGSNADSGRGASEPADFIKNEHLASQVPSGQRVLRSLKTSPSYQPPQTVPHCQSFSSFRGNDAALSPPVNSHKDHSNRSWKPLFTPRSDTHTESAKTNSVPEQPQMANVNISSPSNNLITKDSLINKTGTLSQANKITINSQSVVSPPSRMSHKRSNNVSSFMGPAKSSSTVNVNSNTPVNIKPDVKKQFAFDITKRFDVQDGQPGFDSYSKPSNRAPGSLTFTDDDAASTTSGSYTIDSNDLENDLPHKVGDYKAVVV